MCAIEFGDNPTQLENTLHSRFPAAILQGEDAAFTGWVQQTVALIEQPGSALNLPLDIQGTAFQRKVWNALQAIPSGTRVSYSTIAQRIGQPRCVSR